MITSNNFIQMARKWQKQQKKGILRTKAEKGHFVVYSMDNSRFVVPLVYLKNNIFRELFKLAEEEFGLSSKVPLTLPCDSTVLKYVIRLIQRNVAKDMEEAVLMSITSRRFQSYLDLQHEQTSQHLLCSY